MKLNLFLYKSKWFCCVDTHLKTVYHWVSVIPIFLVNSSGGICIS